MNRIVLITLLCACFFCGKLSADTVYFYMGPNFTDVYGNDPYSTSDHISGWISTPTAFDPGMHDYYPDPPTFSFTDGRLTIDSSNYVPSILSIFVDQNGNISDWSFFLSSNDGIFGSCNSSLPFFVCSGGTLDFTYNFNTSSGGAVASPGHWSVAGVPEPSSLTLLGLGGVMCGIFERRIRVNC